MLERISFAPNSPEARFRSTSLRKETQGEAAGGVVHSVCDHSGANASPELRKNPKQESVDAIHHRRFRSLVDVANAESRCGKQNACGRVGGLFDPEVIQKSRGVGLDHSMRVHLRLSMPCTSRLGNFGKQGTALEVTGKPPVLWVRRLSQVT